MELWIVIMSVSIAILVSALYIAVVAIEDEIQSGRDEVCRASETYVPQEPQTMKKRDNLARTLELVRSRGMVQNGDVQAMLGVSDATAGRYLERLEREGKIKQVGGRGKGVGYRAV